MSNLFKYFKEAFGELTLALYQYRIFFVFGFQEIRSKYSRNPLGPLWITLNILILISTIGFVFGLIFKQDMKSYLPYLAIGLIIWTFIQTVINECCSTFLNNERMILQIKLSFFTYIFKDLWKNIIVLSHHLIIIPILILIFGIELDLKILLIIPGFFLVILNLVWISTFLSLFCARFRDGPLIIQSLLQISFYLTPIIWKVDLMSQRSSFLITTYNPFYHMVSVIRDPIINNPVNIYSWGILFCLAFFGILISLIFYGKYYKKIPFWL